MKKKRFAGLRPSSSTNNSPLNSSRQHHSHSPSNNNGSTNTHSAASSEISAQTSDRDVDTTTPIPSLHGNLVRNRYRRDPLEFYEQLNSLGEGSMGSVCRVRKRAEVIGGSARAQYRKSHAPPNKFFTIFPFLLDFCPTKRRTPSYSSETSSGRYKKVSALSGSSNWTDSDHNGQNCFLLFCCPTRQSPSSALTPISEDRNLAGTVQEGVSIESGSRGGCWEGVFGGFFHHSTTRQSRSGRSSAKGSFDFDDSADDNLLTKEDYDSIDRHVERKLKHATSSLITYGHKDVEYALKSIHLDRVSSSDFMKELKNEVSILKELDHPNIVKCYETFNYNHSLYLVLEICSGSDLYSRDPYSEEDACKIIRSLLSAVAYMHSKNITHRDLKYENIMFANSDPQADVKIIDFGLSKKYADNSFLHDTVGTVYTMAPELLRGGYTQLADVWSTGVISFMLLSSSMPFYGKDRKQVIRKIVKGSYHFISRRWKSVSADAAAVVVRMLQHDAANRPSAAEMLEDPWFHRADFDFLGCAPEVAMMDKVQASIQSFSGYGKLKQLGLMLIAYKSTVEEIGYLRNMFQCFDLSHDGELTLSEFKDVLRVYEYTDEELDWMFHAMDLDGTKLVHYSEFLAATIESHGSISEEQVAECFDRLDNDDSGHITKEDIVDILGADLPESYINAIIAEADLDNDKKISYSEFLALWDEKGDETRKQDQDDVKERRHRKADSAVSLASSADFSDDSFDALGVESRFSFETDEIVKMLSAPDTPVSGDKRISAVSAFVLEKERSSRNSETGFVATPTGAKLKPSKLP